LEDVNVEELTPFPLFQQNFLTDFVRDYALLSNDVNAKLTHGRPSCGLIPEGDHAAIRFGDGVVAQ
jgi:hypothetical protein